MSRNLCAERAQDQNVQGQGGWVYVLSSNVQGQGGWVYTLSSNIQGQGGWVYTLSSNVQGQGGWVYVLSSNVQGQGGSVYTLNSFCDKLIIYFQIKTRINYYLHNILVGKKAHTKQKYNYRHNYLESKNFLGDMKQ